ncbi:hypothetical protein FB45DRAFT_874713 [Roridomyces roridus]|uniref:Uncharacterized protein n=1 Tax=Roridomyces roridus TaxID=1738132 RepID=A0AAD7FDH9_9AGAR|nr:hypothetical protein FB45DRAFT_874817 [Roridomyces roridus]KAJ7613190.1 hypothetical protein FB45DRAFT_874713 [Roridomyces roridus]
MPSFSVMAAHHQCSLCRLLFWHDKTSFVFLVEGFQDEEIILVNPGPSASFVQKVSSSNSLPSRPAGLSHLSLVGVSGATATSRKAANPVIEQGSSTPPQKSVPPPYAQEDRTYPPGPPEPAGTRAFIEPVDDEEDDEELLLGTQVILPQSLQPWSGA